MAQNNTMTQPAEDLTMQPALRLLDADAPAQTFGARIAERRDNVIVLEFERSGGNDGRFAPVIPAKRRFDWSKMFDAGVVLLTVSSAATAVTMLMTMGHV